MKINSSLTEIAYSIGVILLWAALIFIFFWAVGTTVTAIITRTDKIAPSTAFPAKDDDWWERLFTGPLMGWLVLIAVPLQIFEPRKKTKP